MSKFIYSYLDIEEEEFVNIDLLTYQDIKVFLDPFKIANLDESSSLHQYKFIETTEAYFNKVVTLLKDDNLTIEQLGKIEEVNELKLGYGEIDRETAIGTILVKNLVKSFNESKAFLTGLLTDLYDTNIFIENIGNDRVSDWVGRINYLGIYNYTIDVLRKYPNKFSFKEKEATYYNIETNSWQTKQFNLPTYDGSPFLLVPIEISTPGKLSLRGYNDFIDMGVIELLQKRFRDYPKIKELSTRNADGSIRKPTKKAIREFLNIDSSNINNLVTTLTLRLNLTNIEEFLNDAKETYKNKRRNFNNGN